MFFNTLKKERAHSHELLSHELEKMRTPIECIIQSVFKKNAATVVFPCIEDRYVNQMKDYFAN